MALLFRWNLLFLNLFGLQHMQYVIIMEKLNQKLKTHNKVNQPVIYDVMHKRRESHANGRLSENSAFCGLRFITY